jgi:hypothetical protein
MGLEELTYPFSSGERNGIQMIGFELQRSSTNVHSCRLQSANFAQMVHVVLWLLSKNKHLTRGNSAKRKEIEDRSSLMCAEKKTISRLLFFFLLFLLISARRLWSCIAHLTYISEVINLNLLLSIVCVKRSMQRLTF